MNIMVCYDGSDRARNALEKTIEFFKNNDLEIILLTVVEAPLDASMENEEVYEEWRREHQDALAEVGTWVSEQGIEVDVILAVGDPRDMILETVSAKKPDMVVVAKRGKSVVKRMVLGSVSAYVVRHATCPVMVIQKL